MQGVKASLIKGKNWLLYSNIFIALCAVALTAQTLFLLQKDLKTSPALLGLVFFSTWFIYALHRLVSWRKLDARLDIPRFQIIGAYQQHIKLYALFSAVAAGLCFLYLERATQQALLLPALLSLGYVLPFIGKRQLRLRDLHFVKIFLIAVVWAYVTVVLPFFELQPLVNFCCEPTSYPLWLLFLERALFIFIITLPFDLRDWKLDQHHAVKTIPTLLGPQKTIYLGLFLLVIWCLLITANYAWPLPLGYWTSALWTGLLLWKTLEKQPNDATKKVVQQDHYYTGWIDGTMLVQAGLVIGMGYCLA